MKTVLEEFKKKLGDLSIKDAKVSTTICPYCSVGCSILVYTKDGKVVNIEGDPESPINEGTLCPKGASLYQLANNPYRATKPLYRAPYSKEWQEVSWDFALDRIARLVKETRDNTFVLQNEKGQTVNRCEGIAHVGSAALDNEECYILQKLMRALGLIWIEHQARI